MENRRSGPVLLVTLIVLAAALPALGDVDQAFRNLGSPDYAERFDAILSLVVSAEEGIDARLARLLKEDGAAESTMQRTAAEFVRWRRSGQPISPLPPTEVRGTSFILVSIDTLRQDHLGCYGYPRNTSPAIDRLARSGAVFDDALSPAPWTLPTHMSLLTSLYPSFHKLDKGGRLGTARLDDSEKTLAELLNAAGYTTAGFVAHPFLAADWGFDRGFDLYRQYDSRAAVHSARAALWLEWHQFNVRRKLAPAPFFLFLHFIDPHEPYDAPVTYQKRFVREYHGPLKPGDHVTTMFEKKEFASAEDFRHVVDLYDAEISYVDENLGRLLHVLDTTGLRDSAVIVIVADHGEEFKDHDSMGHKETLYDEQLRVPLVLSYPRRIRANQRVAQPVSLLDILPTFLELAGAPPLTKAQGISLTPYLSTNTTGPPQAPPGNRYLFAELGPLGFAWEREFYLRSIQTATHKLIYRYDHGGELTKELYDLIEDPGEKINLYGSKQAKKVVRDLEPKLDRFIRSGLEYNREFRRKNEFEINDELREKLESLGYLK